MVDVSPSSPDGTGTPRASAGAVKSAAPTLALAALPLAGVTLTLSAAFAVWLGSGPLSVVAALTLFCLGAALAMAGVARHHPLARLGPANLVTLGRLALAAALIVPLAQASALPGNTIAGWSVLALAVLALALDGVDGWLARRTGLASAFGARFDMEVDAVLSALLALLVWQSGAAGAFVLVLGFTRYVFVAACALLPWLAAPLPESLARKAVCVLQIGALIACLAPALPTAITMPVAAFASLALAWSFGRDIIWLHRRRSKA